MVFRKPYAFLIKHFKLLHLILAGLMIYLSIKINMITSLFNNLARNISVSLVSLSDKYVNIWMYFVSIFILIMGFIIFYLMKSKKKPNKYYIFLLLYYFLLFVFLVIYSNVMVSLENTAMTNQALRAYRDIAFLFPFGQYYFIIIAILRGIGFNIKQFNFSKDIKDLEISEEDSEEIEVNLSSNFYKYGRAGRKRLRELKYYFFENKFWILIILSVILISWLIYFFINYKFVNNNYGENRYVNASIYRFQVNKTMVVSKNLYGEVVDKDKKYVILDLSIINNYYEKIKFDTSKFRLFIGDNFYYPVTHKNSEFKDVGLFYDNKSLDLENIYNYILIFEIDDNVSTNNMRLKVYDKLDTDTNKVNYVNINLNPINLDDEILEKNLNIGEKVIIDEDNFGLSNIIVNNYEILNNYEYFYDACVSDVCSKKTGVISPKNILKNKLIVLDYNLNIDKNSKLYNFVKNDSSFYNTFVTLTYTLNGEKKSLDFKSINNSNVKDKIFVEVSKEIENADIIELIINTRKVKYICKLK